MRSIRRSLLGYQLLLLALALGAVVVFVDRFAVAALQARRDAETKRIELAFDTRRHEAQQKFDDEMVPETKALDAVVWSALRRVPGVWRGGPGRPPELRPKDRDGESLPRPPEKDAQEFRSRAAALLVGAAAGDWRPAAAATALGRSNSPAWSAFDAPRVVERLRESLQAVFDDDRRLPDDEQEFRRLPAYYQFHVVAFYPGHRPQVIGTVRSPRLREDWPLNLAAFDKPDPNSEAYHDDVEDGTLRRIVARGPRFQSWLLPPWYPLPGTPPPPGGPPGPGRGRHWDYAIRVFIHYARPHAELEERLVEDKASMARQIEAVQTETRESLTDLRTKLGLIGGCSFLALVVGGWVIVARGLAPIRKLSDAVSLVSEKDFRLPVGPAELSRELVPILARLTQTLDLLRRAFEREKQAVADISHELRTPIASLLATIDVSLRKPRTPEQYRTTLTDCRAIAKQLGQLVERIMTLASLDAGTAQTAAVRTDAADLAAGCAAVIRPLAEAHGQTFHLTTDGAPDLDTDPDKLREVLMNLLHNAVEYNRPAGRVELAVRRDGDRVAFEVRDTGIGMTPDVRERIFERFYRADPSRHSTGVHAGLGLAIVKEYVERLGGAIGVESQPDAGSTFRVTLPAASPAPAAESDDAGPPAGAVRPEPRYRGLAAPARS